MTDPLEQSSLRYHSLPTPGKLEIASTKPLSNQLDLAQAYSPGVAYPCLRIKSRPDEAALYTTRGNLVAVITNGTAVLGLGNIGPLAAKPVMEGKAVIFKRFAGIDVFDLEVDETDPDMLVEVIARLEPTFGGINLEDIKAPECFEVERKLRARMNIPVFHDDQHGTAIVSAAAIRNGLRLVNKTIEDVKLVSTGGGGATARLTSMLRNQSSTSATSTSSASGGTSTRSTSSWAGPTSSSRSPPTCSRRPDRASSQPWCGTRSSDATSSTVDGRSRW